MRCKHCSKTFRTPPIEMRKTQVCSECRSITQNNVNVKDIDISKGQAKILKNIARSISDKDLSEFTLRKALREKPEIIHFINENWGNREYFIKLALENKHSNPISLILYFLNLKYKINEVPTKEKMNDISKFYLSEYEYKFGTWEKFLDLLGFDPWYRNNGKQKEIPKIKPHKNKIIQKNVQNYFTGNESKIEMIEKIKLLKTEIKSLCEKKDLDENYSEYSYREMFDLLQEYLKILPNETKYNNVNYFL